MLPTRRHACVPWPAHSVTDAAAPSPPLHLCTCVPCVFQDHFPSAKTASLLTSFLPRVTHSADGLLFTPTAAPYVSHLRLPSQQGPPPRLLSWRGWGEKAAPVQVAKDQLLSAF